MENREKKKKENIKSLLRICNIKIRIINLIKYYFHNFKLFIILMLIYFFLFYNKNIIYDDKNSETMLNISMTFLGFIVTIITLMLSFKKNVFGKNKYLLDTDSWKDFFESLLFISIIISSFAIINQLKKDYYWSITFSLILISLSFLIFFLFIKFNQFEKYFILDEKNKYKKNKIIQKTIVEINNNILNSIDIPFVNIDQNKLNEDYLYLIKKINQFLINDKEKIEILLGYNNLKLILSSINQSLIKNEDITYDLKIIGQIIKEIKTRNYGFIELYFMLEINDYFMFIIQQLLSTKMYNDIALQLIDDLFDFIQNKFNEASDSDIQYADFLINEYERNEAKNSQKIKEYLLKIRKLNLFLFIIHKFEDKYKELFEKNISKSISQYHNEFNKKLIESINKRFELSFNLSNALDYIKINYEIIDWFKNM